MKTARSLQTLLTLVFLCQWAIGQWTNNPAKNTPVATASSFQRNPTCSVDGTGGAVVVWEDDRSGNTDIYVQRIDALGRVRWQTDGVPICTAGGEQMLPMLVTDGSGGAIIAWTDYRSGNADVYAQRINASGAVLWSANGAAIASLTGEQFATSIAGDGHGGAIIVWTDSRSGSYDVYAQRVDANGVIQWAVNGIAVCASTGDQVGPVLIGDGNDGAIVTWSDPRNGITDIYAQSISSTGTTRWTANGIAICTSTGDQDKPALVSDGSGGAIIAWTDGRSGSPDIYAQRVSASGSVQWTSNGVPISTAGSNQTNLSITDDDSGGAVIVWEDFRNALTSDVYAQRVNVSGNVQWTTDGVPVSIKPNPQSSPRVIADGRSGVIIGWQDARGIDFDIYAQHLDAAGNALMAVNGAAISTAGGSQSNPTMVGDGIGGAIILFDDTRNSNDDIFAQRIDRYDHLGYYGPTTTQVRDVRNDQGGKIDLLWSPAFFDTYANQTITSYLIWRGTSGPPLPTNPATFKGSGRNSTAERSVNQRFVTMTTTASSIGTIYWQLVDSVKPRWLPGYVYAYTTPSDSGPQGIPWTYFMVTAATADPFVYWDSQPDSGYSVDNLPPLAPQNPLVANGADGHTHLTWSFSREDHDLSHFEAYRSLSSGFVPGPATLIGSFRDTLFIDSSTAPGAHYYYRITAVDIHGNESSPTPELSAIVSSMERMSSQPAFFALDQNYPNPFNPTTVIGYQVPAFSNVNLRVYDLLGHEVAVLVNEEKTAGHYQVIFDAGGLPSGVYYYRIAAGAFMQTRTLLLLR